MNHKFETLFNSLYSFNKFNLDVYHNTYVLSLLALKIRIKYNKILPNEYFFKAYNGEEAILVSTYVHLYLFNLYYDFIFIYKYV